MWFGFGEIGLTEDDYLEISTRAGVAMVFSAFLLIPFILTILVPFQVVKKNIIFLILSIATVMGPVAGLASVTYEFPSLMGGLIGCGLTAMLINFKVGLADHAIVEGEEEDINTDTPIELVDLADIARGYHRAISDLTEAVAPSKSVRKEQSATIEEEKEAESSTPNAATNMTTEGEDETKKLPSSGGSISNGHWTNVEVQQDLTKADDDVNKNTVVYVEDADGDKKEIEKDEKVEPPLVEEEATKSQQPSKTLTKSEIVKQSAMSREDELLGPRKTFAEGYLSEVLMRTFPIWGVVLLLILTRVQTFKIKQYLTKTSPYWEVQFGTYGDFRLSVSAVIELRNILTYPQQNWKYELFYIPFLIPFVLVSVLTMILYRKDLTCKPQDIAYTVTGRLYNPAIAVCGALILVQLMIRNDAESPAFLLGVTLADWLREGFIAISPLLGALGSFFSGSTTVSNLTFGEIQAIAAEEIGTSVNTMLALQALGASAGNGICLNNIISALAVVGLNVSEGQILMRTFKYVFASTTIATVVMLAFFFRFD